MSAALVESVREACYNGPARVVLPDHESRSTESRTALASRSDEACDSRGAAFLFAECEVRMTPDQEARFWAMVGKDSETGCWNWLGFLSRGYGAFSIKRKALRAHRVSWEHANGPVPSGLVIDHLCRNRACVNPAHLEVVTMGENVLRGNGPTAINRRATHCASGHEFTPENTKYRMKADARVPHRVCRACNTASCAETRRKRRQAAIVDRVLGGS